MHFHNEFHTIVRAFFMLLWAEFLEKGYNMTNNGISLKSSNGSKKGKKGSEKRLKNSPEDNPNMAGKPSETAGEGLAKNQELGETPEN